MALGRRSGIVCPQCRGGIGGGERVRNVFGMEVSRYPFSEAPLRQVAETTGGLYRGVTDGDSLRDVYEEIDRLAKTEIETVEFMHTPYIWRALGGAFFVAGVLVMVYNMVMTLRAARREQAAIEAKLAAKMAKA